MLSQCSFGNIEGDFCCKTNISAGWHLCSPAVEPWPGYKVICQWIGGFRTEPNIQNSNSSFLTLQTLDQCKGLSVIMQPINGFKTEPDLQKCIPSSIPLQNLDHCIQGYLPNGSMASERNPTFRTVFSVLQHCKTFINEKRFSLWINCFKEAPYLQKCILSFTRLQNQDQRIKV